MSARVKFTSSQLDALRNVLKLLSYQDVHNLKQASNNHADVLTLMCPVELSDCKRWILNLSKYRVHNHVNRQICPDVSIIRNLIVYGDTTGRRWEALALRDNIPQLITLKILGSVASCFVSNLLEWAAHTIQNLDITFSKDILKSFVCLKSLKHLTLKLHDCEDQVPSFQKALCSDAVSFRQSLVSLDMYCSCFFDPIDTRGFFDMMTHLTKLQLFGQGSQQPPRVPETLEHLMWECEFPEHVCYGPVPTADFSHASRLTLLHLIGGPWYDGDMDNYTLMHVVLPPHLKILSLTRVNLTTSIMPHMHLLADLLDLELRMDFFEAKTELFQSIGATCSMLQSLCFQLGRPRTAPQNLMALQDGPHSSWHSHRDIPCTKLSVEGMSIDIQHLPPYLIQLKLIRCEVKCFMKHQLRARMGCLETLEMYDMLHSTSYFDDIPGLHVRQSRSMYDKGFVYSNL
jgi:hypothetical protein